MGSRKTPPQHETIPVRPRELLATLRKGEHAVRLEKRQVCGVVDWLGGVVVIGEELIFSIDGHWRRMRVFEDHGARALSDTIVVTIARLEASGWVH